MDELVTMTSKEIRKKYGNDSAKIKAMLDAAPEFTLEEMGVTPGPTIARGLAAFKEYMKHQQNPAPVKDKKVTVGIRLPESVAAELRLTKQYSRRIADYVLEGFTTGALKLSK